MNERVAKITGQATHMLNCYLGIKHKYALLEPMIFDKELTERRGSGRKGFGYSVIRYSLFYDCIQDIVKISFDNDKRTPSIANIIAALSNNLLRNILRERFAAWNAPVGHVDREEVADLLKRTEEKDENNRRVRFDEMYAEVLADWNGFENQKWVEGFRIIRDKLTAHLELRKEGDEYKFTDVSALNIQWGDLGIAIDLFGKIATNLYLLINNTDYAMDHLEKQLANASKAFWE